MDKEEISLPFLKKFQMDKDYIYFRDYFLNKTVIPDTEENIDKIYLHFWNHFDKSRGHEVLRKIIAEFKSNEEAIITKLDTSNLGHWSTCILNVVINRSFNNISNLKEKPDLESLFWRLFTGVHVFDAEDRRPNQIGDSAEIPKFGLSSSIDLLALASDKRSDYIKNSPLFPALLKLDENIDTYLGVEHVEAAAVFDEDLNDPIMAWNCLVNAAYWSGENTKETLLPAWEAAIYLAEKHNWKDAHFALKSQYDWYIDYKKKNNL